MENTNIYTAKQVDEILKDEFIKFEKKHHVVINGSDIATLAKFIEQVKETLNKPQVNLA